MSKFLVIFVLTALAVSCGPSAPSIEDKALALIAKYQTQMPAEEIADLASGGQSDRFRSILTDVHGVDPGDLEGLEDFTEADLVRLEAGLEMMAGFTDAFEGLDELADSLDDLDLDWAE